MSRRHAPERESGYGREDRGDRRDGRATQREREGGSRTPVRTTAEVRSTTAVESRTVTATDPRSAVQTRTVVESRDNRDTRAVPDPRAAPNPRDTAYARDPRTSVEDSERIPAVGRDIAREARAAPPGVNRDGGRETRFRPEEIPPRQGPTNDYFLPGEDISREVITADICRYLGPDALVRPYTHQDGRKGFLITAYRALTSAMIATLKQDSQKFEAENRRRVNAGHRPQTYAPAGYDQPSRMDMYGDDRTAPMTRVDSRFEYEPEPRRSRAQPSGYEDMMDIDDQPDPRARGYAREPYDSRDPQARPQVPAGYAQSGRDPYYDSRSDPRLDSRVDPRLDPRTDPRVDPRADPRMDPRADPRMDLRMDPRMDPRIDPRMEARADPRMDQRGYSQPTSMAPDRDYPMTDSRAGYGDPRTAQPIYAAGRPDQYGALPPGQAASIPRAARDEPQVYIDPQTGRPMMAAPRSSEVRHARPDRDYDSRGHR